MNPPRARFLAALLLFGAWIVLLGALAFESASAPRDAEVEPPPPAAGAPARR